MSSLRILTYNISWEGQTGKDSAITFGSKCIEPNIMTDENEPVNICRENVKTLIKQSNADIILLQEVGFDIQSLGLSRDYKYASSSSGQEVIVTIFNTSKLGELIEHSYEEFSTGRPFHVLIFKDYIIVNLHRGHNDTTTFQNDMDKISVAINPNIDIVNAIVGSKNLIIGGDFNITLQNEFKALGKAMNTGRTIQTQNTCCTPDFGTTKAYRNMFDYIAIDEKLNFQQLQIPLAPENNKLFSDHLPVFAVVYPIAQDLIDSRNNIQLKIVEKGTRFYRGVDKTCDQLDKDLRNNRNEWVSQFLHTSLQYAALEQSCILEFKAKRDLKLVNLWTPSTMRFVLSRYNDLKEIGVITDDEILAFKIFSGYGIDKSSESVLPAIQQAKDKGWVSKYDKRGANVYVELTQSFFPNFRDIGEKTIEWNGLRWGNKKDTFNRTSTYAVDAIVMDTLRDKIFNELKYDGVYCIPTPSTYHFGFFIEEFIIFKDPNEKLQTNRKLNVARGGSISSSRRLPSVPKRRDQRSSSSSKKRYTRRQRALRSGKGGYRARVTGRKV